MPLLTLCLPTSTALAPEPERPLTAPTTTTPAAATATTTASTSAPVPRAPRPVPAPLTVPPPPPSAAPPAAAAAAAPASRTHSLSTTLAPVLGALDSAYGAPRALTGGPPPPAATTAPPTASAPRTSSFATTLVPVMGALESVHGVPRALLPGAPPAPAPAASTMPLAPYAAAPAFPPPTAAGYTAYHGGPMWPSSASSYPGGSSSTAWTAGAVMPLPPPPPVAAPARLAVTHAALVQDMTSRANPCIATSSTEHVWTVSLTDEPTASGKRVKPGGAVGAAGAAAGEAHSGTCDLRLWLLLDAPVGGGEAAFVEFDVAATLTNVMDVTRVPLVDRGYVLCRATHLVSVHLRFKVALRRLDTYRLDVTLNVKGNAGEACPVVVRGLPSQITLVSRRTADRRKASFQTPDHASTSTDPPGATCTPPPQPAAKRARLAVAPDTTPPLQPTVSDMVPPPVMNLDGSAALARALALMSQPDSPAAEEVMRVVGAVSANRVARLVVLERWITRQVQEFQDGTRGNWTDAAMRAVVAAVGADVWDPELWVARALACHGAQFPLHAVVTPARLLPLTTRPTVPVDPRALFAAIVAAIDPDTLCAALAARNSAGTTPAVLAARHPNPVIPTAFFAALAHHIAIGPVLTSNDATGECAASIIARRGADGVRVVEAVADAGRAVRGGVKAVLDGMREYVEGQAEVWGAVCLRMMDAVAREEEGRMQMRDEMVTSV
ncbi:hypothetical protein GGF32_008277 [Allomyces javanicus]|nr:hypothetical protein GGF32_008277 [Allomyces javanicus]